MKLTGIVDSTDLPGYIVVDVAGAVTKWVHNALLNEGRCVHSGHKDYMLIVDSQNPSIPT